MHIMVTLHFISFPYEKGEEKDYIFAKTGQDSWDFTPKLKNKESERVYKAFGCLCVSFYRLIKIE